jgi:serine/threonine protein kinase/Tol biopolymer transport system component
MALDAGTRLGPYEVLALVGTGASGDVYTATDTRVSRTVALRTLPSQWADDPDRRARFERDAQIIAGLSHPHICALHDVSEPVISFEPPATSPEPPAPSPESSAVGPESLASPESPASSLQPPVCFLVTEHLEGETLATRLARGPLPLNAAVKIAIDLTDALDKAHQKGIVHRDLKPSNIFLARSTTDAPRAGRKRSKDEDVSVKLLDFGLATALSPAEAGRYVQEGGQTERGVRLQPDFSRRTTRAHVLAADIPMAALQYMAPEQLEGTDADARTDIFAFGAIFYEMVTGTKAFEGKNRPMLIAAVASLDLDPLSKAQPAVPPALDHVAERCLEKDPDDRWQTAHDLNLQLRWITEGGAVVAATTRGPDRRLVVALAAALLVTVGMATPAVLYLRSPGDTDAFQFRIPVYGVNQSDIAISPNGETLALVARPDPPEASSLYVRPVGSTTFRRVAGTDDATQPFWSADSRSIGFVAGGKLKKVDASTGPPQIIGDAQGFTGGAWNSSGAIVFGTAKGLFRVSAEGGKPEAITGVEKQETGHYWPNFLPDGRHYVYLAWSAEAGNRAVYLGTLDSKEKKRLMAADSNVAYAHPGYLVYHREDTLFAQRWDAKALALTGDPVHLADELSFNPTNGRGNYDVSQHGDLLYFQGQGGPSGRGQAVTGVQFGWRDRTGNQLGPAGEMGTFGDMDLSPDGKLFAVTRQEAGAPGADIWVTDWQRGVTTRLTLDPADDVNPVWSPDGLRVAFTTFRKGNADIYVKNANGVGAEAPLLDSSSNEFVEDWSKDGRYLAYKLGQDAFEDIYALPLSGDRKPIPVVQGQFHKDEPQFSYDGKWIAYTSDESGTFQVYVIEFPGGKERHQISTNGGGQPRWRRDGKELFYKAPDNGVMAVDITLGARIESTVPRRLFYASASTSSVDPVRHQWSVTPDGQRFLLRYPNGGGGGAGAGTGRGGRGGAAGAGVAFNFTPTGQAGQAISVSGRGPNFSNFPASGLTVIRNWTAMVKKAAQ